MNVQARSTDRPERAGSRLAGYLRTINNKWGAHHCESDVGNFELIPETNDPWSAGLLEGLFGAEVRALASRFEEPERGVTDSERALVEGVHGKRRLEFLTGRALAKNLFRDFGYSDVELLRDPDRVPLWPEGIIGSITHSVAGRVPMSLTVDPLNSNWREKSLCVVAVARASDRKGVGIDVEPDQPVRSGLEKEICDAAETRWIEAEGVPESGRRCRIVFSIKEAVYKAFFPRVRKIWGFHEVHTEIDLSQNSFCATLPAGADRAEIEGRIFRREGWILSAVEYE